MNTKDTTSTVISIRAPKHTSLRLSQLAKTTKRSRSALVGEALEQYVAHQDWIASEIERGLIAAQAGELVKNDSITAWITTLETKS